MKRMIDLTHTLIDKMPVYPGDMIPVLEKYKNIEDDEYNNFRISMSMHAGTHIDGPMHMTPSKTFLSDIDINV
jgi:kynurenine formamidase